MAKKKKKSKNRTQKLQGNPVAKAVRTPLFRQQIVPAGKGKGSYVRLPKHQLDE